MEINGIKLITDRSLSDVEIAKSLIKKGLDRMTDEEKNAFFAGLKGAYNYTDVNRVESIVEYLANRLVQIPNEIRQFAKNENVHWYEEFFNVNYDPKDYEEINAKNNWTNNDIFTKEERNQYLQKILFLFSSISYLPKDFPDKLEKLTYSGANNIEKALISFYDLLQQEKKEKENLIFGTKKSWYYSGDLYGGEV